MGLVGGVRGKELDKGSGRYYRLVVITVGMQCTTGLCWWLSGKESACNAGDAGSTSQNGCDPKSLQVINVGEGVEKREPSYTVGGNAN